MYKRVFLDANILVDIIDPQRQSHKNSAAALFHLLDNRVSLFTSCDVITTIYYLASKRDRDLALEKIIYFNKLMTIIEFSNHEVSLACDLILNSVCADLEDAIQYVLAKKLSCDLILTNDKSFVSNDIPVLGSKEFCDRFEI